MIFSFGVVTLLIGRYLQALAKEFSPLLAIKEWAITHAIGGGMELTGAVIALFSVLSFLSNYLP